MKHTFILIAALGLFAASCKKNNGQPQQPDPSANSSTVQVRLRLSGDILSADSPLPNGRQAGPGSNTEARMLRDSTIYAVMVRKGNANWGDPFTSGMFTKPDSIILDLPVDQTVTVIVRAFRKGSGGGIHYIWQNGKPYFEYPVHAALTNKMDSTQKKMIDTVSWLKITSTLDSAITFGEKDNPETDLFYGKTTFLISAAPISQSLELKRHAFGVQLAATGFTTGKLRLEIDGSHPKSVTPADINSKYFVFASDLFKFQQQFARNVTIKWEKPDGNIVIVGQKAITFKRNILTKIQVAVSGNINLDPVITDTEWGTETVVF